MKPLNEFTKEISKGIFSIYSDLGYDAMIRELHKRFYELKDGILIAWFAEYGFEPGKAVLVEDHSTGAIKYYVREATPKEMERAMAMRGDIALTEEKRVPCECQCHHSMWKSGGARWCPLCGTKL